MRINAYTEYDQNAPRQSSHCVWVAMESMYHHTPALCRVSDTGRLFSTGRYLLWAIRWPGADWPQRSLENCGQAIMVVASYFAGPGKIPQAICERQSRPWTTDCGVRFSTSSQMVIS